MKSEKEKLMGKRAVVVDRRNNALNQKKYERFNELSKEIEALTMELIKLGENKI